MAKITLDGIVKQYEAPRLALDHVDLTIEDGETLSVVGGSGCGKSTLLKVIAGLEHVDGGRVLFNDQDVTELSAQDRGVGMVFQDYALYPVMKGRGNLGYYFEVHNASRDEEERRVRETAQLMGVDFELLLGQMPETLSGGQKQRVAIARCIVRFPNVFLMDEPISNLDAKLRESTRIEIRKLLQRFKITTVYVTHDQREAIFMGDRIAVMRAGRLEQVGTYDALYYTPANRYVATFVGAPPMALLPVVVESGAIRLEGGAGAWALQPALAAALPVGPALLGVRPESWRLGTPGGVPAELRHIERQPTERALYLHCSLGGVSLVAVTPQDAAVSPPLTLEPDWEQIYLFERDSETTLHTPGIPELF